MSSPSILFAADRPQPQSPAGLADAFHDLHLHELIAAITRGREEYRLAAYLERPLPSVAAVRYRHGVFHDIEGQGLRGQLACFGQALRKVRDHLCLSQQLRHPLQKQRWLLAALRVYCEAVACLGAQLAQAPLRSQGLTAFRGYLAALVCSQPFTTLRAQACQVEGALAAIRYGLLIEGSRIEVRPYEEEIDYSEEVTHSFARFTQGEARDYLFRFPGYPEMNHVETEILERVALLFPQPFAALADFCEQHHDAFDRGVLRFEREIQFYLAYLDYMDAFQAAGLGFCYPEVAEDTCELHAEEIFDPVLAAQMLGARQGERRSVVTNSFRLQRPERVLVVTGANQGGKTTFARAFGQLHYLAALGCPVPAGRARLALLDALFTHFERQEAVESLAGKLEDELLRMHSVLMCATPRSLLIMNESFGSTSFQDALFLAGRILQQIIARGTLCVCVTFLDELASLGPATVSMVSQVDACDPEVRTFKVVRAPAPGVAHALAIARKYRLTRAAVRERVTS